MTKRENIKKKRLRRVVGDVIQIDLGIAKLAYCRVLENPLCAFYNCFAEKQPQLDIILSSPVLFRIWVSDPAFRNPKWEVIAKAIPLSDDLKTASLFFKQDSISKKLYLYQGGQQRPANRQEVEGLERAAVWDDVHVEDRLRDYLAGRPCKWIRPIEPVPGEDK